MHRPWALISVALVVIVILVVAYAWIDGGRETVRPVAVPVTPEALR